MVIGWMAVWLVALDRKINYFNIISVTFDVGLNELNSTQETNMVF